MSANALTPMGLVARQPIKVTVLALLMVGAASAAAEDVVRQFEIVPFGGWRLGGEFSTDDGDIEVDDAASFGVALNLRADYNTQWQVYLGHQSTELQTGHLFATLDTIDVDVSYLQFGGTYYFDGASATPYVAATVGVSHFDPNAAGVDSENFFAVSFAGGLRVPLTARFGLNLEARWLGSFVDSDSEIFCFTSPVNNACQVRVDGTLLSQFDFTLGAVFGF